MDALVLDDGRAVELGERTSNGSKNETRFGVMGDVAVVVKIQLAHGDPSAEHRALEFLATSAVPVPRPLGAGTAPDGRPFLVISCESGVHTGTPDGWARFGRDLATLLDVPVAGCPFRRVSIAEFVSDHTERLLAVRPLLAEHLIREIEGAIAAVAESDRLVITHGDPGTGNYLDREDDNSPGILLDWETATVSPFGLDLGRAIFISLLDLRHTGISAQLAPALISGYTERAAFTVSDALLRAWTTIAGLQFIHGRHLHPLRADRTPQIAAQTLSAYLDGPLLG